MAAIPRTKAEQEKYDEAIRASQAAAAAKKLATAKRNTEDKEILKGYEGVQVGGAAAGNKAAFVQKSREETAAAEMAKRVAETGVAARTRLGEGAAQVGASAQDLALAGESAVGIAALENFEQQDFEESPKAEDFNEGQITDDQRDANTTLEGFRELGGLVADIQKERNYDLKGPETPKDFASAQEAFNEKFNGGGSLRAKEGETGDQFEARLKERNTARKELAKLAPKPEAPSAPEAQVADIGEQSSGIGFGDTTIDPNAGAIDLPTITSPQAKSSAQAVADKPASGQTPPTIQSPQERLKGRQEFGAYLENQLSRSGGNYTFNKDDQARAKSLGVGRKEMDNFMNKLSRRDEEEPRRRRRLGQIGGNKFGA